MYDSLAEVYDRFIDWPARLNRELPHLTAWLGDAHRLADVACGTGRHAIALAERGYEVVGYDASGAALARAAAEADGRVRFHQRLFGDLAGTGEAPFDALLCLGNSLSHVLNAEALQAAVDDFAQLLRPGGKALIHLRNLPLAAVKGERWLPLRAETAADGTDWIFQRLYDFEPDGRIAFHFVVLHRPPGQPWQRRIERTHLRAWTQPELATAFAAWSELAWAADLAGQQFEPAASGDLFLTATR